MISQELRIYHKLSDSPTKYTVTDYGKTNSVEFYEKVRLEAFNIVTYGLFDTTGVVNRVISPQMIQSVHWDK